MATALMPGQTNSVRDDDFIYKLEATIVEGLCIPTLQLDQVA